MERNQKENINWCTYKSSGFKLLVYNLLIDTTPKIRVQIDICLFKKKTFMDPICSPTTIFELDISNYIINHIKNNNKI